MITFAIRLSHPIWCHFICVVEAIDEQWAVQEAHLKLATKMEGDDLLGWETTIIERV